MPLIQEERMMITIDKDRFDFLLYAYFSGSNNPYPVASKRAYRDLCRTLRFNGGDGHEYREDMDALLEKRIRSLLAEPSHTQAHYDEWHQSLCEEMVGYYHNRGIEFNIGHAQKWVNMTMKYLYIHGGVDVSSVFDYLHVPLDQYVFTAAEGKLSLRRPCAAWSKICDYKLYLDFQKKIRAAVDVAPLRWEFQNWIEEAAKRKGGNSE